jgi:hypothetical protein
MENLAPIFERLYQHPNRACPSRQGLGLLGVHGVEQLETELAIGCYELQGLVLFATESAENATSHAHELLRTLRSACMQRRYAK